MLRLMPPLVLFIFKKFNVLSKLIVLDFVNFVEVARGNASVCGTRVHALEFCDNVDGGRKRELEVDKGSVEIGLDFVPFVVYFFFAEIQQDHPFQCVVVVVVVDFLYYLMNSFDPLFETYQRKN